MAPTAIPAPNPPLPLIFVPICEALAEDVVDEIVEDVVLVIADDKKDVVEMTAELLIARLRPFTWIAYAVLSAANVVDLV